MRTVPARDAAVTARPAHRLRLAVLACGTVAALTVGGGTAAAAAPADVQGPAPAAAPPTPETASITAQAAGGPVELHAPLHSSVLVLVLRCSAHLGRDSLWPPSHPCRG